jgi:pyrroline-5-carboxylate reductase
MRILFIGGGNMATALIGGLLSAKTCLARDIRVVEPSPEAAARLATKHDVACVKRLAAAPDGDEIIIFAVKPQQIRQAAQSSGLAKNINLVVSIAAGVRLADLSASLGGHTRLIRAMPNTPALVGLGVTGLYPMSAAVTQNDRNQAEAIMKSVGSVIWIRDEKDMDGVTAVSGSGPAYVFYFIEALQRAAQDLGFDAAQARAMAIETFAGATRLAAESDEPLEVLRARVTSKGGTTEAALKSLEAGGIGQKLIEAVHAAARRSAELGDEFSRNEAAKK